MKKLSVSFFVIFPITVFLSIPVYAEDEDATRNILKQGLLGAGTGALAAGTSGGKAGQGALVGAGTAVIGGALLDAITTPSGSSRRSSAPVQEEYYDQDAGEYYEEVPQPAHQSGSANVLKQGLVGAGAGALAAGTSGGNAGQGALVVAGTAVIGSALLDTLSQPSQPKTRRVYRKPAVQRAKVKEETVDAGTSVEGRKKIIKKYDESGKLVSEEEVYY